MTDRIHKLSIIVLKYAPVIAAFVMMCHTVLLLHHIETEVADWTFSLPIFPCIVCCLWSKTFNFCVLHRLFIIYTCVVSYCIKYQDIFGFGLTLTLFRIIIIILGLLLFIYLSLKKLKHLNLCHK